jgi:hypothetical protein
MDERNAPRGYETLIYSSTPMKNVRLNWKLDFRGNISARKTLSSVAKNKVL